MSLKYQEFYKIIVCAVFVLAASDVLSVEFSESPCVRLGFSNSYYLIGIADIEEVSRYFQKMSEEHFEGIKSFTGVAGRRHRLETYFDTSDFQILDKWIELSYLVDENLPNYRDDRESVIFRDNNNSPPDTHRFEAKRYKKRVTSMDKHPLFGRVKRKERKYLIELIARNVSGKPEELAPKLKVEHQEVVYLISHFGSPYAAITMDKLHIANFGVPNTTTLLKYELYPNSKQQLNKRERDDLNAAFCSAQYEFKRRFPNITPMSWIGYADYQKMATEKLPSRIFFQKYPLLFQLGQIAVLSMVGFLLIYLILGRHKKRIIYKNTKIQTRN